MLKVDEIKRRREALGLEQVDVARRAGFSIQRYNNIEAGRRAALRPDALYLLAKALECSMEDLIVTPKLPDAVKAKVSKRRKAKSG